MSVRVIHPPFHESLVAKNSDGTTATQVTSEAMVVEHITVDRAAVDGARSSSDVEEHSADQVSALAVQLVAVDEHKRAWIDVGGEKGLVPATIGFAATPAQLAEFITMKAQVIARRTLEGWHIEAVVGVVLPPPTPADQLDQLLTVEAHGDGHRVRLSAEHEIVLSCGKSSITLRANGRIIIKGAQVESYALGTNRIKGGQVRIN